MNQKQTYLIIGMALLIAWFSLCMYLYTQTGLIVQRNDIFSATRNASVITGSSMIVVVILMWATGKSSKEQEKEKK